ncbi:hypothetical protein JIN85_01215 [Luteolibacter pohnpeiensis]|uniref:Uncharacterized protein n=1 Tax=Luteolibacter pohnpeiensis TaxID=454153 RepID=A0A934S597_9BACT|nr:hypothetical protein [Luteolibacter pohnpeiensis]MBK1881011.1 hypothetical protein [Luteolibacter pohnpeiensis]
MASLNPFAAIEKLIDEHGSAKIMKERLALAADQYSVLERENASLREQLANALSENETLKSCKLDLEKEIVELRPEIYLLEDPAKNILQALFDASAGIDIDTLIGRFSMGVNELRFHLESLMDLEFIKNHSGWPGSIYTDGYGQVHHSRGVPESFSILKKGRVYIMRGRIG